MQFQSLNLRSFLAVLTWHLILAGCGSEADQQESTKEGLDASPAVAIRVFDSDCKETGFIRGVNGQNAVAHLRISGATSASHSVGIYGEPKTVQLSFNKLSMAGAATGSYAFEVVVRDKARCLAENAPQDQCDPQGGRVAEKRGFDSFTTVNFVILEAPINQDATGAPNGNAPAGILGTLGGLFANLGQNSGVLGTIIGMLGNGNGLKGILNGGQAQNTSNDPNKDRCLNGVPDSVL